MSHTFTDGMLVVAQLKRNLLGGAVYKDVAIRRDDGDTNHIGTVLVLDDMKHAMVPGSRGRFYTYNVLGSKGVHGFRPVGRPAHGFFPNRWEIMFYFMAAISVPMVLWFIARGSWMVWLSGFSGPLSLVLGAAFTVTRIGAMRAYRADDLPSVELQPAAAQT